jgi:hypothetical protein
MEGETPHLRLGLKVPQTEQTNMLAAGFAPKSEAHNGAAAPPPPGEGAPAAATSDDVQ